MPLIGDALQTARGVRSPQREDSADRPRAAQSTRSPAGSYIYLTLALVIAFVVAIGFGRTLNASLIHPASPRPSILYAHAAMFTAWVILFVSQSALVRARRVASHRRLGVVAIVLGCLMPVVGVATALTMTRRERRG